LDFLELVLGGKNHGLGPRGCGPRQPGPLWTGGHCHEPELIGAQPPAAPVVGVAGRGAARKAAEQQHIIGEGGGGESSDAG
jgi:hypothetical protein